MFQAPISWLLACFEFQSVNDPQNKDCITCPPSLIGLLAQMGRKMFAKVACPLLLLLVVRALEGGPLPRPGKKSGNEQAKTTLTNHPECPARGGDQTLWGTRKGHSVIGLICGLCPEFSLVFRAAWNFSQAQPLGDQMEAEHGLSWNK